MTDFEKLLELLGFQKLSTEKQKEIKDVLKKLIDHYQGEKNETCSGAIDYTMELFGLEKLDEASQAEIRGHLWKEIKSKAGYHSIDEYDFKFGQGFNNSLKGAISETTATGSEISGPDSPKIGDLYTRKKDAQGIFRQSPMPKKQSKKEKQIEKQLQKIKDLFQSRNLKDISLTDIEKILQNESSPYTSSFNHTNFSGFKYVRLSKTNTVVHSNTNLATIGSTLTDEKIKELQAMGVKIYFSESLNEGTQNKNELIKALANLLEWAKGNRGSKSGNPYLFPEVKNALKVLGKIEGVNYLDVDTKKLSEGILNEEFYNQDNILDEITFEEMLTTVETNIPTEEVQPKMVQREFDRLLAMKIKDAKFQIKKAAKQIATEVSWNNKRNIR